MGGGNEVSLEYHICTLAIRDGLPAALNIKPKAKLKQEGNYTVSLVHTSFS